MTIDPPPAVEGPRPPDAPRRIELIAANFLLLGCLLGALRGAWIVAAGAGGLVPWIEAAYAATLHVAAGYAACVAVRVLGAWSGSPTPVAAPSAVAAGHPAQAATAPEEPPAAPAGPPPLDPGLWRERIRAAREANDPARVLELREDVPDGQDEGGLKELDAELGPWFLGLVHRRLRSGPLQGELVTLVDRASETLGHTKEGASLRAALPTLRRGAGLCPRCARPYAGVWEACPECMGRPEPPPPVIPGLAIVDVEVDVDVDDSAAPTDDGGWFLDPDESSGAGGFVGR